MSQYKDKKTWCAGKAYQGGPGGGWGSCSRLGKYEEDGKWWCFQHQPSKEKARRAESSRQWKERWDEQQKARDQRNGIALAEQRLVEACLEWREETVLVPTRIEHYIEAVKKARAS